jgi:hypothetical protein
VEFDVNGDGSPDYTVTNFNGATSVTLDAAQPSTFAVAVKVFDTGNALIYSGTRWIQAVDPSLVGYRALSAFNGMVDELVLGNASGALRYFTGDAQAIYQDIFNKLGSSLPQIAQQLGTLKQGSFGDSVAEFILLRDTSDGPKAFPVYLYKGPEGIWRLEGM